MYILHNDRKCTSLLLAALLLLGTASLASASEPPMVCTGGRGSFSQPLAPGLAIAIGAEHSAGFARRVCEAHFLLNRAKASLVAEAWAIDADALNVDMGLNAPIAALQIRAKENDRRMSYALYALGKQPRLLRLLTGGSQYNAADTDLDGRIEIWTDDAAAIDGIDNLPQRAFDPIPPVVLRFEKQRLVDVSAEFRPAYDHIIASLRSQMEPQQLAAFKTTDGRLDKVPPEMFLALHDLLTTKVRALQIVWCYLASGRETEAWRTLDELWPASDRARIQTAITTARARGWKAQVDAASLNAAGARRSAAIYQPAPDKTNQNLSDWRAAGHLYSTSDAALQVSDERVDVNAVPIQLFRPIDLEHPTPQDAASAMLRLVIDAAGKVRTATLQGPADPGIVAASTGWKFIPGQKNGHAVASELTLVVNPAR
jgi:hypothetical protein